MRKIAQNIAKKLEISETGETGKNMNGGSSDGLGRPRWGLARDLRTASAGLGGASVEALFPNFSLFLQISTDFLHFAGFCFNSPEFCCFCCFYINFRPLTLFSTVVGVFFLVFCKFSLDLFFFDVLFTQYDLNLPSVAVFGDVCHYYLHSAGFSVNSSLLCWFWMILR